MAKAKLFHAGTQQVEEAEFYVDKNNEVVAQFADGHAVKFPAGLSKEEFQKLLTEHQKSNTGQIVITAEMEAEQKALREASLELINETSETATPVPTPPTIAPVAPATPPATSQTINQTSAGDTTPQGQSNAQPVPTAPPAPAA